MRNPRRVRSGEPPSGQIEAQDTLPRSHRVPSFLVHRLRQICLGIMDEVCGPHDLSVAEYGALTSLDELPGLDQNELARHLGVDKVSAGQIVDRLERRGLVDRRVDPADRRARILRLTPPGLALRRKLQPAALAAQGRILAPLAPKERTAVIDLLTRLVEGHGSYARPGNGRRPRRSPAQ
jgi:DNA-binding MarR family transcriptional regulator